MWLIRFRFLASNMGPWAYQEWLIPECRERSNPRAPNTARWGFPSPKKNHISLPNKEQTKFDKMLSLILNKPVFLMKKLQINVISIYLLLIYLHTCMLYMCMYVYIHMYNHSIYLYLYLYLHITELVFYLVFIHVRIECSAS